VVSLNLVSVNNFNFEIMSLFEVLIETYEMGGPFFMFIITLLGLSMFFFAVKSGIKIFVKKNYSGKGINYILMFGSLSFIFGLLAQAIGMFQAFEAIQQAGDISPALVAGGFEGEYDCSVVWRFLVYSVHSHLGGFARNSKKVQVIF
jgi:hypothetical protein